jgi:uncharacterized protein YqgV (UPF0045/DUF77 family)
MLVAFSVAPAGGSSSDSVHDAVADAVSVVRASGLPNRTDAMFTTIEGEWDECMAVVRAAVDAVQEYGTRVSLVLKADIRPGHTGEITGKLDRLEAAVARRDQDGDIAEGTDGADPRGLTAPAAAEDGPGSESAPEAEPEREPDSEPAASQVGAAPVILARLVAPAEVVTVLGAAEQDLPIPCAVGARLLVSEAAPPMALNLVEVQRAILQSDGGRLRVVSGAADLWAGEVGESVSVVASADRLDSPTAIWIQLSH